MWLQRGKWWELFECGWLQCDCKGVIDENCLRVDDFSVTAKGIIDENCFGVEDFDVITKGWLMRTVWGWMTDMTTKRIIDENCFGVEDFDVITKGVIDENCLRVEYWYDYKEDN